MDYFIVESSIAKQVAIQINIDRGISPYTFVNKCHQDEYQQLLGYTLHVLLSMPDQDNRTVIGPIEGLSVIEPE